VIADASIVYPGRDIVLDVHDDPVGDWDGERLRQVVRNLVGTRCNTVNPIRRRDFVGRVRRPAVLSVVNRGPPVPDELRPHLFEPFRRGTTKGTGVGSVSTS